MSAEERAEKMPAGDRIGSRYMDKRMRDKADELLRNNQVRSGSRYADKQKKEKAIYGVRGTKVVDIRHARSVKIKTESGSSLKAFASRVKAKDPGAIALCCALGVLAAGYIGGAVYFRSHFYPQTKIAGIPCARQTADTVKEAVEKKISDYTLTINGREGGVDVISAADVNLTYKDNGSIEKALRNQKSYLWPYMIFHPVSQVMIGTDYSDEAVDRAVHSMNQLQLKNETEPQDACLKVNGDGYYEIVPEVKGTTLYTKKVEEAVINGLNLGAASLDLEQSGCYLFPKIVSTDAKLNEEMTEKNKLMGAVLSFSFGDHVENISVGDFIEKNGYGKYYLSENAAAGYVKSLAQKYDTYGMDRDFHTSLGTTVHLSGGDYGWELDQEATTEELLAAIKDKRHGSLDPIYTHTAMSRGMDDIGGTYVEISISGQTMWCYQNSYLVVETPVVTGNTSNGHGTPSNGVWAIDDKQENATLVGQNYRCPVKYWMPFNGGVGIHDLSSRSVYGGNIYEYAGSHGCINTPLDAVSQVFDTVSVGTPVIVYD